MKAFEEVWKIKRDERMTEGTKILLDNLRGNPEQYTEVIKKNDQSSSKEKL